MDEKTAATIPFFVHEGEMARAERTNKRLWILAVILILALIGTNAGWIIYENQFEEQEYTVSVQQDTDGSGDNTFTGNTIRMIGGDENGQTDGDDNDPAPGEETGR